MKDENNKIDLRTSADLEAEAYELDAQASLLRAAAVRLRATEQQQQRRAPSVAKTIGHMKRSEYAHARSVSDATVSRWVKAGMPTLPVGTTDRIDPVAADEWRRTRPRMATTPPKSTTPTDEVDVSDSLARAGITKTTRTG